VNPAQAKLDAEREAAKAAYEARPGVETKGVAPGAKRPSRSKAAQEERKAEMEGMEIVNEKAAGLYLAYGDPRNKEKGYSGNPVPQPEAPAADMATPKPASTGIPTVEELEARMEAAAEEAAEEARVGNVATTDDGTQYDKGTGEVVADPNEEPAWMRGGPPPAEEF
jgi:hypothetical protein